MAKTNESPTITVRVERPITKLGAMAICKWIASAEGNELKAGISEIERRLSLPKTTGDRKAVYELALALAARIKS